MPAGVVLGGRARAPRPSTRCSAGHRACWPSPISCRASTSACSTRVGFRAGAAGPVVPLPEDAALTEALAADLREAAVGAGRLARAPPPSAPDREHVRTVAGLAMSGVVLTCDEVAGPGRGPRWARRSSPR